MLRLVLRAGHSAGFNKCIMSSIHRCIIQSSFIALKISVSPMLPAHPHPHPGVRATQPLICSRLCSSAFSRMFYRWDDTLGSLFRLAPFIWPYAFTVPPCLLVALIAHFFLAETNTLFSEGTPFKTLKEEGRWERIQCA